MARDLSVMGQTERVATVADAAEQTILRPAAPIAENSRSRSDPLIQRWQWVMFPLVLFFCTRIALFGFAQISMTLVPTLAFEFGSREFIREYPFLDGLCRWDCWHFGTIARDGYTEAKWTNFFPLFPLLVRGLALLTGMPINLALIVVPNLACLGAFLVIYRMFMHLADEQSARWGLMLLAAYPFAFFQAMGYPESLMIFTSALALWLALRGNHIAAGVALGFGVLGRHLTMFAGAGLLVAQIRQRGLHPRRLLMSRSILGLVIPWIGLALYSFYQYRVFGNPMAFAEARDQPPWSELAWWGLRDLLAATEYNEHIPVMYSYIPFALLVTVGAISLFFKNQWIELAAFGMIFIVMMWGIGMWGLGRYTASCWPAFLPLGVWLAKHPHWQGPVIALLALFQGLFFFLHAHMFPIL
jgi:hypothetical protein